jgi:hypothetical protein
VHCEYFVKKLLHVCASFILALFKDTNLVNNNKRDKYLLINKEEEISLLKNDEIIK